MLAEIIIVAAQACQPGRCPQPVAAIRQPTVVAVASVVPGKTVVKYKRNLFGRLVPVYAEVSATVAITAGGNCAGGRCK